MINTQLGSSCLHRNLQCRAKIWPSFQGDFFLPQSAIRPCIWPWSVPLSSCFLEHWGHGWVAIWWSHFLCVIDPNPSRNSCGGFWEIHPSVFLGHVCRHVAKLCPKSTMWSKTKMAMFPWYIVFFSENSMDAFKKPLIDILSKLNLKSVLTLRFSVVSGLNTQELYSLVKLYGCAMFEVYFNDLQWQIHLQRTLCLASKATTYHQTVHQIPSLSGRPPLEQLEKRSYGDIIPRDCSVPIFCSTKLKHGIWKWWMGGSLGNDFFKPPICFLEICSCHQKK